MCVVEVHNNRSQRLPRRTANLRRKPELWVRQRGGTMKSSASPQTHCTQLNKNLHLFQYHNTKQQPFPFPSIHTATQTLFCILQGCSTQRPATRRVPTLRSLRHTHATLWKHAHHAVLLHASGAGGLDPHNAAAAGFCATSHVAPPLPRARACARQQHARQQLRQRPAHPGPLLRSRAAAACGDLLRGTRAAAAAAAWERPACAAAKKPNNAPLSRPSTKRSC